MRGRTTTIFVILFIAISEIVAAGIGGLSASLLIRWAITAALCYFLYRGQNWARWLSIVLFGFVGLAGVITGLLMLGMSAGSLIVIAISSGDVGCAAALLFGPGVADNFENSY